MRRVEFGCFSVRFPLSKIEVTVVNSISTDLASVTCSKRSLHVFNTGCDVPLPQEGEIPIKT